ncbi:MAG: hypothetical protein M3O71_26120 [Bacteroidota bacterium]|nr:hypothetical protein [Bacteroidota bacterium]
MNQKQLTLFLEGIKTDLINSIQASGSAASSQTISQMKTTVTEDKAQLQIPGFLQTLESGRGPTPKNATRGEPPMITRIKQWCQQKGIPEKEAWAIKKAIDKHGFKGKPGILSQPLSDENIDLRLKPVMESVAEEIVGEMLELL